jgi:hypothetical protein
VFSYSRDKTSNVPITTVATLWELPDGEKLILIIHKALYFGERLKTSTLLTPNQLRANGLVVDNVPRQFKADSTHTIFDPASGVRIPLSINGQASGFVSQKPRNGTIVAKLFSPQSVPGRPTPKRLQTLNMWLQGNLHQKPHYQKPPSTILLKPISTCGVSHLNLSSPQP